MKTDVRNTEGCLWVCPVHRAPWSVVWGRASPRASGVGQRRGMPVPAGYVLTSPQSQPPTAVRCGQGVCWMRVPAGTGWWGEGHPCGLWLTCGVTLNVLLTCPVQVTFMAWGRHSGWHCTHSEFSTNSLGSLTGEDGKLVSAVPGHPAAGCCLGSPVWELRWHKSPLLESQNSFREKSNGRESRTIL